jgi:hypothetical protein
MTTPYADLTTEQKEIVSIYDKTAREFYEATMEVHRIAQRLSAIHSQNSTLFLTTMNASEVLPVPTGGTGSVTRTGSTTNGLNNARIEAEARISANVSAKTLFRTYLGSDKCAELG